MEISSSRAKKCLGFYSPKYNLPPNLLSLLKCTKVYLFTRKNTIRDEGSTALYAAYTVDTVDMAIFKVNLNYFI